MLSATFVNQDLMMTPEIAKNVKEHLKTECEKQDLPISPDEMLAQKEHDIHELYSWWF